MQERLRSIELAPQVVEAYAKTFIPRWDIYPLQLPDGTYAKIGKGLTLTHIFQHLTEIHVGRKPLTVGAYALDSHSQVRWLCLDADDEFVWRELLRLGTALERECVPAYLERSRRGGHMWLFTPLLSGKEVRQFGNELLRFYQIQRYDENNKLRLELYPKQDALVTGPGSFMRLPLGAHMKTRQVYPFVDLLGQPLTPTLREQIALLAHPKRVPLEFIEAVCAQAPPEEVTRLLSPPFKKHRPQRGEPLSEALKGSISVLDFVGRYIVLDERAKGFCPFHDDQKKSFQINEAHNYWHCYAGCGGGTIIDFWMRWRKHQGEDGSFKATLTDLRHLLID